MTGNRNQNKIIGDRSINNEFVSLKEQTEAKSIPLLPHSTRVDLGLIAFLGTSVEGASSQPASSELMEYKSNAPYTTTETTHMHDRTMPILTQPETKEFFIYLTSAFSRAVYRVAEQRFVRLSYSNPFATHVVPAIGTGLVGPRSSIKREVIVAPLSPRPRTIAPIL